MSSTPTKDFLNHELPAYFKFLGSLAKDIEVTAKKLEVLNGIKMEDAFGQIFFWLRLIRLSDMRRAFFIGNGGSAAIASHAAIDFWKNGGIRAQCFNEAAQLTCLANDFGYERVFSEAIKMFVRSGDVLFAISSSGKSPNITNAVQEALRHDCFVVTFSGFSSRNHLRTLGHINFYVPSDAYGFVELSHQIIIHAILDLYTESVKKIVSA